jgi:5-methylcytosine-specific restriction endonuclease McrA
MAHMDIDGVCPMDIDNVLHQENPKRRRKYIPAAIKRQSWYNLYGKQTGEGLCQVCCRNYIYQSDFECGHIISEYNNGPTSLDNLLPICKDCNKSISRKNIVDYVREYHPFNYTIFNIITYIQNQK